MAEKNITATTWSDRNAADAVSPTHIPTVRLVARSSASRRTAAMAFGLATAKKEKEGKRRREIKWKTCKGSLQTRFVYY